MLNDVKLHLVETWEDTRNFQAWLTDGPMQHGRIAFDTETTGLSVQTDRVRMVQLGDTREGWAIPAEGPEGWTGLFADAMRRFTGTMYAHNAPYDYAMLNKLGITLDRARIRDTRIMAHIREPHMSTALKAQTSRHVDPAAGAAQRELDDAIAKFGWGGVSLKFIRYWTYAALDPVLTLHLADVHENQVSPHAFDVENSVQWVLESMMRRGALVDIEYALFQQARFKAFCEKTAQWCLDEFKVSPGSSASVVEILREAGYEFSKITASGAVSLDKEVLGEIDHPLAQAVLRYRQISKLSSTYLAYYINQSINGRIYPSINSVGARTGRMSVSEPNLQNLPTVSDGDKAASVIRNCIISRDGYTLVMCDFAQIETRLLAHLSQDPGLLAAFHSPEDFFITLARTIFQDDSIGKKDPRRNIIKTLVYAKIYGAGLAKMAKTLGMSMMRMQEIDDALHTSYPGIKRFQQNIYAEAVTSRNENGFSSVTCPLSGRVHIADPGKEYALVNYLIQGMAAFFFKTKLLALANTAAAEWMILPVHDEIILEVPDSRVDEAALILTQIMNDDQTLSVPVQAEVSYGKRWAQKKDYVMAA